MGHLGFVCSNNWHLFKSISIQSSAHTLDVLVMYIINTTPLTLFHPF